MNLQSHYNDLFTQFRSKPSGNIITSTSSNVSDLNPSDDPRRTSEQPRTRSSSTLSTTPPLGKLSTASSTKSVRFTDSPLKSEHNFPQPYRDDPHIPDHSYLDNQKIHSYNSRVIAQQDESLDRLGESLKRQRELSIQIGSELDEQVEMLDSIDQHVERHETRLKKTIYHLERVVRRAKGNTQVGVLAALVILLLFLIILLRF